VIVLGDESGYTAGEVQKVKLAAIEAEWETEKAPASFTIIGFPDQAAEKTWYAIKIPWLMGLIATRSFDTPVTGIKDLKIEHEKRIRDGIKAYTNWPTIPQLYVKGEFVGGSDIMMEMFKSGELQSLIGAEAS